MEGEYSQEWAELRRRRRRTFRVVASGAVILVAVSLVTTYLSLNAAKMIGLVLLAGWPSCCGFSSCRVSTSIGHAPDAASLTTISSAGTADGTIPSLAVVFIVACPNGWIPTLTQN